MSAPFKRGSTLKVLLEFEPDEWPAIWPWDSVVAEARQDSQIHDMSVTVTPSERAILLTADTSEWSIGMARFDLRAVRSGEAIYLPPHDDLTASIVRPVTEVE